MGTFYRACKLLTNKVISNYNEGKYFNEKTHSMELLTQGTNKYNLQFIKEVKDISTDFYVLITLEQIAIKLMKMNSNSNEAEIRNLWNLIKAQAGTIRYNRLLRHSLKTYAITKKKLLDELTGEMYKQRDRVKRNNTLIIQLLRDYGLGKIIDLVEKENNTTIFEHIKQYALNNDYDMVRGLNIGKDEDKTEELNNYYSQIQDSYIEYLRTLAQAHNLSFDNEISAELTAHRELIQERSRQIDEAKAKERADAKSTEAYTAMDKDNAKIFSDLNSNWWENTKRMGQTTAEHLRSRLQKYGGIVYYIALCKKSVVHYISENSEVKQSLFTMKYFRSAEEAEMHIQNLKLSNSEIAKYFHKVYKLEVSELIKENQQILNGELSTVGKITNEIISKQMSTLGQVLSNENILDNEKLVVRRILDKTYGYSSDRTDATFYLYKLIDNRGKQGLIWISKDGKEFKLTESYYGALKTIPNTEEDRQYREKIVEYTSEHYPNSTIIVEQVSFNSTWMRNGLKIVQSTYNKAIHSLSGQSSVISNTEERNAYEKLTSRLYEMKAIGVNQVHIAVEVTTSHITSYRLLKKLSENQDVYFEANKVHFLSIKQLPNNRIQKRTKYIDRADIFTSYKDAVDTINTYGENKPSIFYRIITLNI